jgi:hypothetical protein
MSGPFSKRLLHARGSHSFFAEFAPKLLAKKKSTHLGVIRRVAVVIDELG